MSLVISAPRAAAERGDPRDETIRLLRERVEDLEHALREARRLLVPPLQAPPEWRLAPREVQLLSALYASRAPLMTRRRLFGAVYGADSEHGIEAISTSLGRLRAKLGRLGFGIETMGHSGYRLTPATRAAIAAAAKRGGDAA